MIIRKENHILYKVNRDLHQANHGLYKENRCFFILLLTLALTFVGMMQTHAQQVITGEIVDDADGYAIPYASASYKGKHVAVSSDGMGKFTIARHNGWTLTISSVGYVPQTITVDENTKHLVVRLKTESKRLDEVTIRAKRGKYSRKDNPAVELMRRVIAAKKRTHLENHEYYQFNKYQKITFGLNDITPNDMQQGIFKRSPWLVDFIETCPYNQKRILPISVDETVTQQVYRKDPKTEKTIIKGQRSDGINNVLQTGEILNTMLKEVFTDVDIYDNHVRLLQYQFPSPIGETAISFYRYYIEDTVYVDRDLCYQIHFIPNNQQDFGFRGDLYILADSTLHVKKCNLTIPKQSDVNFIDDLKIQQEYSLLPNGEWVLTTDDMVAELHIVTKSTNLVCIRTTRLSDYAFDDLPNKLFKGKAKTRHEADAMIRDEEFWDQYRAVELTKGESSMDAFIRRMEQSKNYKWILFGVKAFLENYVETSNDKNKSKFDFGPINTLVSSNFVDGMRYRISGRTTANLNKHLFWTGYYAYGSKTEKHYYSSEVTYAFNKKRNVPFEFPQRNLTFETSKDVMSPSDKYLLHNKDNVFMAFRVQKVEQMYFYNRQRLAFNYETDWGFRFNTEVKAEWNAPTGDLYFQRLSDGQLQRDIRTTEWTVGLKYCPGQTYINTKQQRWPVNLDAPEFSLTHTMGLQHFLGGQYKHHLTQAGIYKRFWLGSWGYLDNHLNAGAQWSKVPFPLLIMPPVNVSFFEHENTFSMMRNMEFLNDRYVFWAVCWDLNGKILNRIPLIKQLKWREYIAFKGMWGKLSDKNNPRLEQNQGDAMLFRLPDETQLMERNTPYMEVVVGVHNIFKFFGVDYVRRLNYLNNPQIKRNGIRFSVAMSF